MVKVTRGVRNNNPLNIRRSGSNWFGMSVTQTDHDFCQFTSINYGLRAAMYLLTKYVFFYKFTTIKQVIFRWAPPSENNSEVYVDRVVHIINSASSPECPFLSSSYEVSTKMELFYLVNAMCRIESDFYLDVETFLKSFDLLPSKFKELWTK